MLGLLETFIRKGITFTLAEFQDQIFSYTKFTKPATAGKHIDQRRDITVVAAGDNNGGA